MRIMASEEVRLTERFYEPVSVIEHAGKTRQLMNLTPESVNGWIKHVCYSSSVRMMSLATGALSELENSRLLNSMVLTRSHMEAAGLACLCNREIRAFASCGDDSKLRDLIPKTYLGTSMIRAQKKCPTVSPSLSLSECDKLSSASLISAFETFFSDMGMDGKVHAQYGLLCDYTHTSIRAMRDYTITEEEVSKFTGVEGWHHQYTHSPKWTKKHYAMAIEMLLGSMKIGHAAAEMLRRTSIKAEGDHAYFVFPTTENLHGIWDLFLKLPHKAQKNPSSA